MHWLGWVVIVVLGINVAFFGFIGLVMIRDDILWRRHVKKKQKEKDEGRTL